MKAGQQKVARGHEDTTRPRLIRAGPDQRVGQDGVRRMTDWPLHRLFSRQHLDRHDQERNRSLYEAGERYRAHWYLAGLAPIGAIDYARATGSGEGSAGGMPVSETQAHHRARFRQGVKALGPFLTPVVDGVCLYEREPEDIGYAVSLYEDRKQARAVALDRLVEGLRLLGVDYGLLRY